ncbi:MAG: AAA family ATPase [Syntrophales bacterium]
MEITPRSKEKLIEEQIKKWQVVQKKKYKKPIRPVITMSRLPGAGARVLAEQLARELKIDYFEHEIIEEIAKSSSVSERIVETLDEQDRSILDDWLGLFGQSRMWSYQYFQHLTKVVGTIGTHGHALILGRGASFILPKEVSLRVLVVAPLEVRIRNVSEAYGCSESEARDRVKSREAERIGFIRKYFRTNMLDPSNYDLSINTENFKPDDAVKIIKEAFNSRQWYNYSVKK